MEPATEAGAPPRSLPVAKIFLGVAAVAVAAALAWAFFRRSATARGADLRPLTPLEAPLIPSTTAARGRETTAPAPLSLLRPYNASNPGDYFGTVRLTASESAEVCVSSADGESGGYFEIVVYDYPSWNVAYAETFSPTARLDFLPQGTYAIVVFAPPGGGRVTGGVQTVPRVAAQSAPPAARKHRHTTAEAAARRDEAVAAAVAGIAPPGAQEAFRVRSAPTFVWPGPVFTRVETLSAAVPEDATAAYIAVPSYGLVVEGGDHLQNVIHETANAAIYRAVAFPGAGGARNGISLTVMYPDIDPSNAESASPSTVLFVYGGGH